ncbi:MAG: phosphoenolpyruvate carboxykinase (ATP), partial [Armatimonadetes bacterium]|nr:phosphoenolpyruvate carboxykinase (ATP) [Armatimonadota bacterium]
AGYTARVAGTERGMGARPEPTFSACFGAPFLPLPPRRYVDLLQAYLRRHKPLVVLMNTGALGGPLGAGGERPPIDVSRRLLHAAQSGALRSVPLREHPQYGILIPEQCPGVSTEWLDPRTAWKLAPAAYDQAAAELVAAFHGAVNTTYAGQVPAEILAAGPRRVA